MKTIGIFPNILKPQWHDVTEQILDLASENGLGVVVEPPRLRENFPDARCIVPDRKLEETDLVIALGGDGTMLTLARLVGHRSIPIMGVNIGSGLGFLAEFSTKNLSSDLKAIFKGQYNISRRITIECCLLRNGTSRRQGYALNETVISSSKLSRLINLRVYLDDEYVTNFGADGLIIATPTGSTAYSLSAGGPIIIPEMECLLITPINPHTLTNRPLLVSRDRKIRVEMPHEDTNFMITLDGQVGVKLEKGDAVELGASDNYVNLITSKSASYFEILQSKLSWGGSKKFLH